MKKEFSINQIEVLLRTLTNIFVILLLLIILMVKNIKIVLKRTLSQITEKIKQ